MTTPTNLAISPLQAQEAATAVYALRPDEARVQDIGTAAPTLNHEFQFSKGKKLYGDSGLGILKSQTGFGFVAHGKGDHRVNQVLVSIRGTKFTSACDWLTNVQVPGTRGPSGHTVHTGFMDLAKDLLPSINNYVDASLATRIHVVGHSLGGAAAALVAESLRNASGTQNVNLYTFGCPRVGDLSHSRHVTDLLGSENIYRVNHLYDPVPWLPTFPYSHMPFETAGYSLPGPGVIFSIAAHFMENYKSSVRCNDWSALSTVERPIFRSIDETKDWLETAPSSAGAMLSGKLLSMILSALGWVLKKINHQLETTFHGATILDAIARQLYYGTLESAEISWMVQRLMAAALTFAGRTVVEGARVTVAFMQFVLETMFRIVSSMAMRALGAIR